MDHFDLEAYIEKVTGGIKDNAGKMARERCGKAACGFQGVVLEIPQPSQRQPGSNAIWLEDMTHGVACTFDEGCYYAQNPEMISTVFTDAVHRTLTEFGILGLVDSGAEGTQQSN